MSIPHPARRKFNTFIRASSLAALVSWVLVPAPLAGAAGETLRIGQEAAIKGFDPLQVRVMGVATLTAASAVLETLLKVDAGGALAPHLVRTLEPDADGRTWIARLRPGVRFQDGTPFDAAAVVFHFGRLLDPEAACPCRTLIAPLERVEAVDALTVRFVLRHPWAALPTVLAEPSLVSLIGSPRAYANRDRPFGRYPVGTGPFRLAVWEPGHRMRLERNPDYWRAGLPRLDAIELRVLPDHQSRLASLRAGNLDLIWTLQGRSAAKARTIPGLRVFKHVGQGARVLLLNTRKPPLDDRRVRRALAHALDQDLFTRVAYAGEVPRSTDPFGPGSPYVCDGEGPPDYDPDKARALLADYGRPVRLRFTHTATPRGRETGQIFQQFWKAVGIEVALDPAEQARLLRDVLQGSYHISAWRFRDSLDPDPDLWGFLHSESPLNVTGLSSPRIDRLLEQGRRSSDPRQRTEAYCALAALIDREVPVLYGPRNAYFAIAREALRDLPPMRGGILNLAPVWLAR